MKGLAASRLRLQEEFQESGPAVRDRNFEQSALLLLAKCRVLDRRLLRELQIDQIWYGNRDFERLTSGWGHESRMVASCVRTCV